MAHLVQSNLDDSSQEEHSSDAAKPRFCCAPHRHREVLVSQTPLVSTPSAETHDGIQDSNRPVVSLPGWTFLMGTNYAQGFPADGEGPIRPVSLSAFDIDTFPVTNKDFAAFIAATKYRTEAEIFGWSFVFWSHIPETRFESLVEDTAAHTPWWCKVPGATWNQPEGPGSGVEDRLNYPVVHVSWNDAAAYAAWASKTLPTEAQWEYAVRGVLEQKLYPWGDDLTPEGEASLEHLAGPISCRRYRRRRLRWKLPGRRLPPNGYGIYSATGNVWEWCADWFHTVFSAKSISHDPKGSAIGQSKVMKGGSFLCHASYRNRYRVAARTSNTPDSSASNIGFRCVRCHSEAQNQPVATSDLF